MNIPPEMKMSEITPIWRRLLNNACTEHDIATGMDSVNFAIVYTPESDTIRITCGKKTTVANVCNVQLVETGNDMLNFWEMLNVPLANRAAFCVAQVNGGAAPAAAPPATWDFKGVWDRKVEHLFFHASFVNHTQFNYLGQSGDFYPKPSKIYTADNLPMDFYFWVSLDGMNPISLPYEDFLVELAFIIDSDNYQSP
jgi:hypothetical protein